MATPFGDLLGKSTAEMNAEIADYKELGVDWVRLDIHWSLVQPKENGGFDWSLVDKVFNALDAAGIKIAAVLNNTPDWVSEKLNSAGDRQAFADFAGAAAQRYGDMVNHWEIFNEPNMKGITPANYTDMLKRSYDAIKAVDGDDTVITGGLAAVPSTGNGLYGAVDYLEQIYANGGGDSFDAVGYHPYTFPLFPSDDEAWNGWEIMEDGIRDAMLANGDGDKQVWMTELGAPTWGQNVTVSEAEQARILREAVEIAKDLDWAGPIMWFGYQDSDIDRGFGLKYADGRAKAAYDLFKELGNADDTNSSVGGSLIGIDEQTGGSGWDVLDGTDKDSLLIGKGGRDRLDGNGGDDILDGGSGDDVLTGGAGSDLFVFKANMGWDLITDFKRGADKIDVSGVDANSNRSGDQSFDFIGGNWLRDAEDLGVYIDRGQNKTYVQGDTNGDGAFDFSIVLNGAVSLTEDDFIL
ncbi:family 1 glycosylhydrolase [Paracoccus sediminicola]|uniref:family 1 glycosylhydrolase n=1 Tax=Paracoccus sediminicola TaxID=3017783 RepID=UPI0022F00FAD|nr:family 1 glycosylhydrolase [Paracoccus sediminicola]WBU58187.1 cellulase family glycosylhydrolase [Paracoccus sediminicola]